MTRVGVWLAAGAVAAVSGGTLALTRVLKEFARSAGWAEVAVDWMTPVATLPAIGLAVVAGRWWARISGRPSDPRRSR